LHVWSANYNKQIGGEGRISIENRHEKTSIIL